jgi:hypothetical protein
MKKSILATLSVMLLGAACIEELDGILFFNWYGLPPDTTTSPVVQFQGEVVRTPARLGYITVVTAVGGAEAVVDTASDLGLFTLEVPLVANSENNISISASDNSGATTPGPTTMTVVHVDQLPASTGDSSQR